MYKIIISICVILIVSFAQDNNKTINDKNVRLKKQMQKNVEAEKKFAKEQKFYQGSEYNLKAHEVNPESLKDIKVMPVDDLDMDNVYD